MRWEVTTKNKIYRVSATNSGSAVTQVRSKDTSEIVSVKLLPKNTVDKLQSTWRRWFGK